MEQEPAVAAASMWENHWILEIKGIKEMDDSDLFLDSTSVACSPPDDKLAVPADPADVSAGIPWVNLEGTLGSSRTHIPSCNPNLEGPTLPSPCCQPSSNPPPPAASVPAPPTADVSSCLLKLPSLHTLQPISKSPPQVALGSQHNMAHSDSSDSDEAWGNVCPWDATQEDSPSASAGLSAFAWAERSESADGGTAKAVQKKRKRSPTFGAKRVASERVRRMKIREGLQMLKDEIKSEGDYAAVLQEAIAHIRALRGEVYGLGIQTQV